MRTAPSPSLRPSRQEGPILAPLRRVRSAAANFAANSNARARTYGVPGSLTTAEVARVVGPCAYCDGFERLRWDHAVPLSRGGANVITNIVPCCLPCNQRKGARTLIEFGYWLDMGWWHPEVGAA